MTTREIISGFFILLEGESKTFVSLRSTVIIFHKLCECNNNGRSSNNNGRSSNTAVTLYSVFTL